MARSVVSLVSLLFVATALSAQAPPQGLDLATIGRIRTEAIQGSQVMDHAWWLSEVHTPRATGTPAFRQASEWAMKRLTEWGLQNVHQERFPFGQGWTIERFSAHIVTPHAQVLIGQPRWNSPSTSGTVLAEVVHLKATSDSELANTRGSSEGRLS